VVIDDVEIGNLKQEKIIADHFKKAVRQKFNQYEEKYNTKTIQKYQDILRQKCSFHLLK
jgi:uncharacterized protein (DUF2249 family)